MSSKRLEQPLMCLRVTSLLSEEAFHLRDKLGRRAIDVVAHAANEEAFTRRKEQVHAVGELRGSTTPREPVPRDTFEAKPRGAGAHRDAFLRARASGSSCAGAFVVTPIQLRSRVHRKLLLTIVQ